MKGRKLRQVEGESRRGGDQASYILIYIFRTTITRCSVGGEFLFVQRRGLFSSFGRTIYITRFRFPIGSWNLSFRVLRFNNLRKQVSIFLKVPPLLSLSFARRAACIVLILARRIASDKLEITACRIKRKEPREWDNKWKVLVEKR